MPDLVSILTGIAACMASAPERGRVASYIPELAKIDPGRFGIAVATVDGRVVTAGDADELFSIQSVSKVFTLTLALGKVGDALWRRVGREPSGSAFNSIVQLELEHGIDERIAGDAMLVFELDDRVEGAARGLAADPAPERVADGAEGECQREHLGHALDRERHVRVAGGEHLPVARSDRDAEPAGVDAGELGDVGGDPTTLGRPRHAVGDLGENGGEVGHRASILTSHTGLTSLAVSASLAQPVLSSREMCRPLVGLRRTHL